MNNRVGFFNLWLFFVLGYGIIWASMIWASRKRGKPIEDHEFSKMLGGKICLPIEHKYGDSYREYRDKVPRYIGVPKSGED